MDRKELAVTVPVKITKKMCETKENPKCPMNYIRNEIPFFNPNTSISKRIPVKDTCGTGR
jgi:hypothetical protein